MRDEDEATRERAPEDLVAIGERVCPACGASARRADAGFCATCGRTLADEDGYRPADALRASYHLQRRRFTPPLAPRPLKDACATRRRPSPAIREPQSFLQHKNSAATTAVAFVTFSLVPYLGIIFCPGSLVMGVVGLIYARRTPERGGTRAAVFSVVMAFVVCCAQIFLWWILYKVPEWSQARRF